MCDWLGEESDQGQNPLDRKPRKIICARWVLCGPVSRFLLPSPVFSNASLDFSFIVASENSSRNRTCEEDLLSDCRAIVTSSRVGVTQT